jgi:mycofactocin precursor
MVANNEKNDEDAKEILNDEQEGNQKENIFSTEEVKIEEMAIDGICGVY